MRLQVYVFGPNVGETIILRYPNEAQDGELWGVIDCHSASVVDFLQEKSVDELEFVC